MSDLDAKLAEIATRYDEIQGRLALPEVTADHEEIRRLGRELARLEPTVAVDEPDVEFGQPAPTTDPILDKALERLGQKKAA